MPAPVGTHKPIQIYQIKVMLRDSHPPIWRQIQVRSDTTLAKLHRDGKTRISTSSSSRTALRRALQEVEAPPLSTASQSQCSSGGLSLERVRRLRPPSHGLLPSLCRAALEGYPGIHGLGERVPVPSPESPQPLHHALRSHNRHRHPDTSGIWPSFTSRLPR